MLFLGCVSEEGDVEVTHCNIIAMAIKSETSVERETERGGRTHQRPKVEMVVVISSSRKATWGFFHCGTLSVVGNGPRFRYGTHEEVASLRPFLPPSSSSPRFASAALFSVFFSSSSLSSSFLSYRPMIQSALGSLRSVFSTVTLCWLVSHACLNTPRWRVNALLTYALTPDVERLTVVAGGQDDDRIRTSWTAAVGQLQLFSLSVGLIDPVLSPCWLSTGW